MTGLSWTAIEIVSRLLEPAERDAVRGDLTESGAGGGQALREVLGLVARRQAALWADWRPWLAVMSVVVPIGILLSYVSRAWADALAIYGFIYADSSMWYVALVQSPGSREQLIDFLLDALIMCAALVGWSWTSGFVLGSLSRRTIGVTATLFALVVVTATIGTTTPGRANPFNAAAYSLTFYGVVLPRLLRLLCVLLPALRGMQRSLRQPTLPWLTALFAGAVVACLTAWTSRGLEGSLISAVTAGPGRHSLLGTIGGPRRPQLLPLAMMWPVAYVVATATWHRLREQKRNHS